MKTIIFATQNENKIREVNAILGGGIVIKSLASIGCTKELPETHETLDENSLEKAQYVWEQYQVDCFAEDTGLEIKALNNEPGVFSARYAGVEKNDKANVQKVLTKLDGVQDRRARFRTVITLIINGQDKQFEGIVEGKIAAEVKGENGFGYDPIFVPDGYEQTFAELPNAIKNKISHRARATRLLIHYLRPSPSQGN